MKRDLSEILGDKCPSIRVVDVGAMDLGPGSSPFRALLDLPGLEIVGFEPSEEECAKLNRAAKPGERYLPYFVGDGSRRTFRWCAWNATSSLYEPNMELLSHFVDLPPLLQVKSRTEVETTRLDDIEDLGRVDLLKIDVQGATLDVLQGGPKAVSGALVVQAEVEFVPLYEGEPLFAEVDLEMRRHGFSFRNFTGIHARYLAPIQGGEAEASQALWSDAVYVKSFLRLGELDPTSLLRLALIVERLYGAADLALLALHHHDRQTGSTLWQEYADSITQ